MNKSISEFIIHKNATLKFAMKQLDSSHGKILFIIDDKNILFGTLTDGDIRRWILEGGKLDEMVLEVCNRNPYFVYEGFDLERMKKEFLNKRHSAIPILNKNKTVVDIIFWNELFDESIERNKINLLDNLVVIMAGGQGTRLEPFTKILPKPLIPIGDKSIIQIIIDQFLKYRINHFFISVNYKSKIIKAYFEELSHDYTIEYIEEKKPLGTVGALSKLKGKTDKPIFITNCDIIIHSNYYEFLEFHEKNNYDISLVASIMHYKIPYGICEIGKNGQLIDFIEKPEHSFLASTGMYLINPEVLDLIPDNEFFHITHLMDIIKSNGGKIGVFPISEKSWHDTGEWVEYKKTLEILKV